MSPLDQAHGMACELRNILGDLFDQRQHGPGSCIERAWDRMDEVIEYLEFVQCGLRKPPRIASSLMAIGDQP